MATGHGVPASPLRGHLACAGDPGHAADCDVVLLTEHAAVLELHSEWRVPDAARLIIPHADHDRACRKIAQAGREAVVEFDEVDIASAGLVAGGQVSTHSEQLVALRSVLDQVDNGLLLLDESMRAQLCNRTFRRMWGLPDEFAADRPTFIDILTFCLRVGSFDLAGDAADDYVARRNRSVQAGETGAVDLRRPDGQVIRAQCTPLSDGGRLLVYTKVTDIVRHADELDVLRVALDHIQDGVLLLDDKLNALFLNGRMRDYFGITEQRAAEYPAYADLLAGAPNAGLAGMSAREVEAHHRERVAAVRAAHPAVVDLNIADGRHIRVNCARMANGGRMLTYSDITDLVRNAEQLEMLATIDAMSGVFNRRHFLIMAQAQWAGFLRRRRPLSVLMVDIDHFKSVNDRHGHAVGDDAIAAIAAACRHDRRGTDVVGRLGGEEFAVLLPETDASQALILAERIRREVESMQLPLPSSGQFSVTISIGVAEATAEMSGIDALLRAADRALYDAKAAGRNCTMPALENGFV